MIGAAICVLNLYTYKMAYAHTRQVLSGTTLVKTGLNFITASIIWAFYIPAPVTTFPYLGKSLRNAFSSHTYHFLMGQAINKALEARAFYPVAAAVAHQPTEFSSVKKCRQQCSFSLLRTNGASDWHNTATSSSRFRYTIIIKFGIAVFQPTLMRWLEIYLWKHVYLLQTKNGQFVMNRKAKV